MIIKLNVGDRAPSFTIKDSNGIDICLEDYKGQNLILYFYPKDNTPGCTAQACNLRDNYQELLDKGYQIIGVSPDHDKSHLKFSAKFQLPFKLIADTDKQLAEMYGVWVEKKLYGKTYMGIARTSFVINKDGLISHIVDKVDTKNHAKQLLAL